ncbi:MAG TPA: hypothetical protein PKJ41_03475 [Bryobacteraceae bacterium]|nr:hypothetical protein [Bryobacteraceae bacterium]
MSQITAPGMYDYPGPHAGETDPTTPNGPVVFAAVTPGPPEPIGPALAFGFFLDLAAGLSAAWLLAQTAGLGYWRKVCFVAMLGLLASIIIQASAWNWFSYSGHFTVVQILDTTLSFALAGLAMARVIRTA